MTASVSHDMIVSPFPLHMFPPGLVLLLLIYSNVPIILLLQVGKTLRYDVSKAPTEGVFNKYMAELKEIKPASSAEALNKKPQNLWANYADHGNMTWNLSTSNFSESTNSMLGGEV